MGQIHDQTTQDDLEGSDAPLGLSRSSRVTSNDGVWVPVVRKALALTLGGVTLAAIGALSMAHHPKPDATIEHLTASVNGGALEWLAMAGTTDVESRPLADQVNHGRSSQAETAPSTSTSDRGSSAALPTRARSPDNGEASGILPDGRVVLNTASVNELQTLPGIGQKRAESIVALRERLKGFKKLSDLLRVKGIGVKSLRKLEPKITLNPPQPSTQ